MPVPPKLNAAPKSFKSPSKEEFFELAGADSNTGIRDNSGNLGGDGLLDAFSRLDLPRSRAGVRHAMRLPAVAAVARDARLMEIARGTFGGEVFPFRANALRQISGGKLAGGLAPRHGFAVAGAARGPGLGDLGL